MGSTEMIDWDVAVSTALRLVRPGPEVPRRTAFGAVSQLRELAAEAGGHVGGFTGLVSAPGANGASAHGSLMSNPASVVDRPSWVRVNADGFRVLMDPVVDAMSSRRSGVGAVPMVGRRLTGMQVGGVLALLAGKVLGQYEIFGSDGRLLLVAPNIVAAEREMGVDPRDFRMWVCLHEVTHRVQFTANPWLRDHLAEQVEEFVAASDLDAAALARRLKDAAGSLVGAARSGQDVSVIDLVTTPDQRVVVDRLTAVMSLLEGHADYVMDGVGPEVVPSVRTIRQRFSRRRAGGGVFDQLVRRLLGLDVKMRQYAEGSRFVREVVDAVGMSGFNRVWASPGTLPTREEIKTPEVWVARVHGASRPGPGLAVTD
ncbi:MAG: zinc-dependent metalloprotease [Actinomycetes bacterium]